jgi:hypothetical protein
MLKAILGALFDSVFGAVGRWLDRARQDKARDDAKAMEAIAVSQTERKETENQIEAAAKAARDNASSDFTTLR